MCNKSTTDLKTHRKLQLKKKQIVRDSEFSALLTCFVLNQQIKTG